MKIMFLGYRKLIPALLALLLTSNVLAQDSNAGMTWERPDVDFSRYSKFLIKPLDISDVKVLKPAWEADDSSDWTFTGGAGEAIQAMFTEIMSAELSKDGGYAVVAEEAADVLQLEVEFLSITPYIKPGTSSDADGYVISTLGSGDVVISAELRDSVTGSLLALVEGERQIGTEYKELSRENHIENLEETFTAWGQRLRARMDAAHTE